MIKINLLNSVTERQGGAVVSVEKKVSSPMSRLLLMGIAVFVLTTALIGWDFISTGRAKAHAEAQLAEQKKKEKELEAVIKEQKELEAKITNIDLRIDAIKKLRNSQAGPSAVLESIRERIGMTPDIYLDSIDQKGDQLTIKGSSPNESAVTQFGRSLEFSSGLFANLSIETQRKEIGGQNASADENAPKKEVINFTIRCAYNSAKSGKTEDGQTTAENQSKDGSSSAQTSNKDGANNSGSASQDAPRVAQNQDN
jgi:Tfp pilus assembly protein PilN